MKTPQININLDSFDFISNELQEEFSGFILSLGDVVIIE